MDGASGVEKVPFWLGPVNAVVGYLRNTEAAKEILAIEQGAPIDLAVRDTFKLCIAYTDYQASLHNEGPAQEPNFQPVAEQLSQCKGQWGVVISDTKSYFGTSPLLKGGAVMLFAASAWVAPKTLLFTMSGSLLLFKNSTAIKALADEKMVKWVEENHLAFAIVASTAGGGLMLWNLNGVGWITWLPYLATSMGTSGLTGVLGGAYLARSGVLGTTSGEVDESA